MSKVLCIQHSLFFRQGERVFDLSEHRPESRTGSKHHFDVVAPARLPDPLTNASYIR